VAKVKVINRNLDGNLNGSNFENIPSQTLFRFGKFSLTSNFDGRTTIDYSNVLSTFVRGVTLETLNINDVESENIFNKTQNVTLNLDRSDLNTFVRFGSAYEFLRVSIQNIIQLFPGSLFVNSQLSRGGNTTFFDFNYNPIENISTFKIPSQFTVNKFNLAYNFGNDSNPNNIVLKNINKSFLNYVLWSNNNVTDNTHTLLGFTGDTSSRTYLMVSCQGNPFPSITSTTGSLNYHLKPNVRYFDNFRATLKDYEKYLISKRNDNNEFQFTLKEPILKNDGQISYSDRTIVWPTSDSYNIDIDGPSYQRFLDSVLSIGNKYDQIKTDLISRFLTPSSLKAYDFSENKKTEKLLKIYGAEFDEMRKFIDSLTYIHKVTYDKKKNIPDQLIGNMARAFGWDYFQLIKEEELMGMLFDPNEPERNLDTDLTPAEVDIELWRRILINTNYFWKSKGTRDAIKSMFLLIGIPEPFINITEYVYTLDGKIDPREQTLTLDDLPSASLPYDKNGYPVAPIETNNFYFQMSGDTDSGQAYMDVFRSVGFNLQRQVDNKKSWVQTGSTYRYHESNPTYYQIDSKLVLNTKEVDVALDTSRGIEYDVYRYIKDIDYPANSSGFTIPFTFVNLSLNVGSPSQNTFTLPINVDPEGDVEIRFNGILLVGPKLWDGSSVVSGNTNVDYYFTGPRTFKLGNISEDIYAKNNTNQRDIIEASYIYRSSSGMTQISVRYIVVTVTPSLLDVRIPLPETPSGDVQLTINGIAATKGTSQFIADYVVDGDEIVIQNSDLIAYFSTNPWVQVAFINVSGSTDIHSRQEVYRIDSLTGGKVYFNRSANKIVYRLNYKLTSPTNVKILVDGIALEPFTDYRLNPTNQYEIYLPNSIGLGSVITAFYLVGENEAFTPVVNTEFGIGDISELSFLEFIELVERKMVNASNRKVVTDFKGGWYPTMLNVYTTYLKRSYLSDNNPLKSNGYTFNNLYSFLNKYNAFFKRFVDQLLSATIIQRKGGLLIRNTVFTKQKFTYKRGVSFDLGLNYFGSDGATYLKRPLSQDVQWTDDYVQIPDFCKDFDVNDIVVEYPTTTTTTTPFYYDGALLFTQTSLVSNPSEASIVKKNKIELIPELVSGYVANVDFNVDFIIVASGSSIYSYYNVIIKNNGVVVEQRQLTETTENSGNLVFLNSETISIQIGVGDNIEITLENIATAGSSSGVRSITRLSPTVTSVTPNGEIGAIMPTYIDNDVLNVN
jgi:hypothetical protein